MKKKITFTSQGRRADVGDYEIYRILPNHYVKAVGPFVFLDYVPPVQHAADEPRKAVNGSGAHPHRGIATLTYVLNGEADHFDSNGHHAKVYSGGAQWMKAGTGIIHDEVINPDPQTNNGLTHGFQFWVNLPAKNKAEKPDYVPVQAGEIPVKELEDHAGWLKAVTGTYRQYTSKIPVYLDQFIYHLHLEPGKTFLLHDEKGIEYAAFLVNEATINDTKFSQGEFLLFDKSSGTIESRNHSNAPIDIIFFGGATYTEPIVAQGPFVMNTQQEISTAYSDFHHGKYGKIRYEQQA
ncbi:pirin family protein [Chitinophaga varians]|uniref:pirin family protein n=1 Tax=Chitinophaga varians TaxID=2202339 RepID=UPI00165FD005|nr:pirin family protein [Chitinophaga varians]MBC9914530.1 pirin family protein [Chitinophaga varians]